MILAAAGENHTSYLVLRKNPCVLWPVLKLIYYVIILTYFHFYTSGRILLDKIDLPQKYRKK